MLARGIDVSQVADFTGLTPEAIMALMQEDA
jgi:hypothetical protein